MEKFPRGDGETHEDEPGSPTAALFARLGIAPDPDVVARTDAICGTHIAAELEMLDQFVPGTQEYVDYLGILGQMAGIGLSGRNPTA